VVVLAAIDGGPAAKAGLRPGDVIVRLDDAAVETVEDLYAELRQRRPGSKTRLTFIRDRRQRETTVTLADRPTS
jgi:S1-C subfamily serine protease